MLACHHLSQKSPQAITRLVFHRETHLGQFLLHLVVHIHVPLLRLDGDEVVAFPEVAAHLVRGMGVNGGLVLGHDALDQIVGMGTGKARLVPPETPLPSTTALMAEAADSQKKFS